MKSFLQLQIIDADAHVIENDGTWEFLEPAEEKYRPIIVPSPEDPTATKWQFDGEIGGDRHIERSKEQLEQIADEVGRSIRVPGEARHLSDVESRLEHMDDLGIDVQVLHNTFWLLTVTHKPDKEAALSRCWNRWLADIWRQSGNRLRWSCLFPTTMMDEAISQIRFAKENGAVAIAMRPIEGNRSMIDPYFYPIYEEAVHLDMAIAVHISNGSPAYCDIIGQFPGGISVNAFNLFRVPTVSSCYNLMMSEIPEVFPSLRWGFIETTAQWVPWIIQEAKSRCEYSFLGKELPEDPLTAYNIFVTCQTTDDIPWILKYAGENSLVIGTDYGHADPSADLNAIRIFRDDLDLDPDIKSRVLHYNPKKLYAI